MGLEAQEGVDQQSAEDLPADGIGVVPEEGAELQGLLELLEEDFDVPSATIEVALAGRAPVRVVGDKDHQALLSVDFNPGLDASDDPAPIDLDHLSRTIFPLSLTRLRRTRKLMLSLARVTN
jgi:hypothetical protein